MIDLDTVRPSGTTITDVVYDADTGFQQLVSSLNDQGELTLAGSLVVRGPETSVTSTPSITANSPITPVVLDTALPAGAFQAGSTLIIAEPNNPEEIQVASVSSQIGGLVVLQGTAPGGAGSIAIVTATTAADPSGFTGYAQFTTGSTAHGLTVGQAVTITGMSPGMWNLTGLIMTAVPNPTTLRLSLGTTNIGGLFYNLTINTPTIMGNLVSMISTLQIDVGIGAQAIRAGQTYRLGANTLLLTAAGNQFARGQLVQITNANPAAYNGYWPITAVTPTSFSIATQTNLLTPISGTATAGGFTATITGGSPAVIETVTVDQGFTGLPGTHVWVNLTSLLTTDHSITGQEGLTDPNGRITAFTPTTAFAYDHTGPVTFTWENPNTWKIGMVNVAPRYAGDPTAGYGLSLGGYLVVRPDGMLTRAGQPVFDAAGAQKLAPAALSPMLPPAIVNYVLSGFDATPAPGTGLTTLITTGLTVTAGSGYLASIGTVYTIPTTLTGTVGGAGSTTTLADNATSYLFCLPDTSLQWGTSSTWPGPALLLYQVVTAAGRITSVTDLRETHGNYTNKGDLLVGTGIGHSFAPLAIGTTGQVLQVASGTAAWGAPPASPPTGPAGGDLSGTYPNPTVTSLSHAVGSPYTWTATQTHSTAAGQALVITGNATSTAVAISGTSGSGAGMTATSSSVNETVYIQNTGSGMGLYVDVSTGTGYGLRVLGNGTAANALYVIGGSGNRAIYATPTGAGIGIFADATGGTGQGLRVDGNTSNTAVQVNAGSGQIGIVVSQPNATGTGLNCNPSGGGTGFSSVPSGSSTGMVINPAAGSTGSAIAITQAGSGRAISIDSSSGSGYGIFITANNANDAIRVQNANSTNCIFLNPTGSGSGLNISAGGTGYGIIVTGNTTSPGIAVNNPGGQPSFVSNPGATSTANVFTTTPLAGHTAGSGFVANMSNSTGSGVSVTANASAAGVLVTNSTASNSFVSNHSGSGAAFASTRSAGAGAGMLITMSAGSTGIGLSVSGNISNPAISSVGGVGQPALTITSAASGASYGISASSPAANTSTAPVIFATSQGTNAGNYAGSFTSSGAAPALNVAGSTTAAAVTIAAGTGQLAISATGGTGISTAGQLISTIVTGTSPLSVASTTKVANLNADSVDGARFAATGDLLVGTGAGTATNIGIGTTGFVLTVVGGTAAWAAAGGGGLPSGAAGGDLGSTYPNPTVVSLSHAVGNPYTWTGAQTFGTAITSTVATGTAPLVVASTTKVANLNADSLDGARFAATGDLLVGTGVGTATNLGIGTTGQVLTVVGGTAVWATTGGGGSPTGAAGGDLGATYPNPTVVSLSHAVGSPYTWTATQTFTPASGSALLITGNATGNALVIAGTSGALSAITANSTSTAQTVYIQNSGTGVGLYVDNTAATGTGYALRVQGSANAGSVGAKITAGSGQLGLWAVGAGAGTDVLVDAAAATGIGIQVNGNASANAVVISAGAGRLAIAATGGNIQTNAQLVSTVATGTAPLVVSSTTKVANLNADQLDGATFTAAGDILVGTGAGAGTNLGIGTAGFVLSVASGTPAWVTPPASPPSGAAGGDLGGTYPNPTVTSLTHAVGSPYTWTGLQTFSGQITSTLVTGTSPLVVASTTKVANLNADQIDGARFAAVGDLLVGTGVGAGTVLGIGTAGFVLSVVSGTPAWTAAPPSAPTGAAGGDLGGTYPNPTVTSLSHAVGSSYTWTATQTFTPAAGNGIAVTALTGQIGVSVTQNNATGFGFACDPSGGGIAFESTPSGSSSGLVINPVALSTGVAIAITARGSGRAISIDASSGTGPGIFVTGNTTNPAYTATASASQPGYWCNNAGSSPSYQTSPTGSGAGFAVTSGVGATGAGLAANVSSGTGIGVQVTGNASATAVTVAAGSGQNGISVTNAGGGSSFFTAPTGGGAGFTLNMLGATGNGLVVSANASAAGILVANGTASNSFVSNHSGTGAAFAATRTGSGAGALLDVSGGSGQGLSITGNISNPAVSIAAGAGQLAIAATAGSISTAGQLISTVVTGTAPLSVASTTKVVNLNADSVDGARFAATGDLLVGTGAGAGGVLGIGTAGFVLSVVAGTPAWVTPPSSPPSGAAGGDLGGTYPNPTVTSLTHAVGSSYTWTATQTFTPAAGGALVITSNATSATVVNIDTSGGTGQGLHITGNASTTALSVAGTSGSGAAFTLTSTSINESAYIQNTGTGMGLYVDTSTGTGIGLRVLGNATSGRAAYILAGSGQFGLNVVGAGTGTAAFMDASTSTGQGLAVTGNASATAVTVTAGSGQSGIVITQNNATGAGFVCNPTSGATAFSSVPAGSSTGLVINPAAGSTGSAIAITQAGSGRAISIDSTSGTGTGINVAANNTGVGINVTQANSTPAFQTTVTGGGTGLSITASGGTGYGIIVTGNSTSPGIAVNSSGGQPCYISNPGATSTASVFVTTPAAGHTGGSGLAANMSNSTGSGVFVTANGSAAGILVANSTASNSFVSNHSGTGAAFAATRTGSGAGALLNVSGGSGIGLSVTGNTSNPAVTIAAGAGQLAIQATGGTGISTAAQFISTLATGTMPVNVTSITRCVNLNADWIDGAGFSAVGDLLVGTGLQAGTKLGIGATGTVLTVAGGTPTWAAPASAIGVGPNGSLLVSTPTPGLNTMTPTWGNSVIGLTSTALVNAPAINVGNLGKTYGDELHIGYQTPTGDASGVQVSGVTWRLNGQPWMPIGGNSVACLWAAQQPYVYTHNWYQDAFQQFTAPGSPTCTAMQDWNTNCVRFQYIQNIMANPFPAGPMITGASTSAGTMTFLCANTGVNAIAIGQQFVVSGMAPAGYNGLWTAAAGTNTTQVLVTTGVAPGTVTTLGALGPAGTQTFAQAYLQQIQQVVAVARAAGFAVVLVPNDHLPNLAGDPSGHSNISAGQVTITSASANGTTMSFGNTGSNGFVAGQSVLVTGMTPYGYNGQWILASATATTFTVTTNSQPGAATVFGQATGTTTAAWQAVAPAFAGDQMVMFELFNENDDPYPSLTWAQWTTGNQSIANAIRALAPNNVLIAGGLHRNQYFGNDSASAAFNWASNHLTGTNIAYAVHKYALADNSTNWQADWGFINANAPLILTEWYEHTGNTANVPGFLNYVQSHNGGVLIWNFDDLGNQGEMVNIQYNASNFALPWTFTPTPTIFPMTAATWTAANAGTLTFTGANYFVTGQSVTVTGFSAQSGYNGVWAIATLIGATGTTLNTGFTTTGTANTTTITNPGTPATILGYANGHGNGSGQAWYSWCQSNAMTTGGNTVIFNGTQPVITARSDGRAVIGAGDPVALVLSGNPAANGPFITNAPGTQGYISGEALTVAASPGGAMHFNYDGASALIAATGGISGSAVTLQAPAPTWLANVMTNGSPFHQVILYGGAGTEGPFTVTSVSGNLIGLNSAPADTTHTSIALMPGNHSFYVGQSSMFDIGYCVNDPSGSAFTRGAYLTGLLATDRKAYFGVGSDVGLAINGNVIASGPNIQPTSGNTVLVLGTHHVNMNIASFNSGVSINYDSSGFTNTGQITTTFAGTKAVTVVGVKGVATNGRNANVCNTTPALAYGAAAGTSPPGSPSLTTSSNDVSGTIQFGIGTTGSVAGNLVTFTYGDATLHSAANIVQVCWANGHAPAFPCAVTANNATGFTVYVPAAMASSSGSATFYLLNYNVIDLT